MIQYYTCIVPGTIYVLSIMTHPFPSHTMIPHTHALALSLCHAVKECDRLSLVTYDTGVTLEFGLTSMTKANKDKTKLLVQSIRDGSCTNLCGGLMEGERSMTVLQSYLNDIQK